jgi:hypothetical protein
MNEDILDDMRNAAGEMKEALGPTHPKFLQYMDRLRFDFGMSEDADPQTVWDEFYALPVWSKTPDYAA